MELKSFKSVLDSLDYTIVDNSSQFLGIENLERIREYLLDKRDGEYKHIEMLKCLCYLIFYGILIS